MRVSVINTQVAPHYWAVHRKWPIGQAVELDVSDEEYAEICADKRFVVIKLDAPKAAAPVVVADAPVDAEKSTERTKKAK